LSVAAGVVLPLQAARAVTAAKAPSAAMPRRMFTPVLVGLVASISNLLSATVIRLILFLQQFSEL